MPWGETYTGSTLVDMYLAELATHTWDLAAATGQLERLERDLAVIALDSARSMHEPEYRKQLAEGSPFGTEVQAPARLTRSGPCCPVGPSSQERQRRERTFQERLGIDTQNGAQDRGVDRAEVRRVNGVPF